MQQYTDDDMKTAREPEVKAFFIVNPGNPYGVALSPGSIENIVNLVKTKRPDLHDADR